MTTNRSFPIIFAIGAALFLSSCALFYPEAGPEAVVGTWTNSMGTVWVIKDDGTFVADLNKDKKGDAWGKYTVSGDRITMTRVGGINPKGCGGKAVYRFKRSGPDALAFTVVSDKCKLRRQNVLQPWHRK
jgi:hypothetical protein